MTSQPAMTIAVEFEVREESPARWIETWGIRAQDALDFEATTTAYEAAIALNDSKRVLVFERYEGGEPTLYEHMDRAAHKTLMDKMQGERLTKRRPWIAMGYEVDEFGWQLESRAASGIRGPGAIIEITALRPADPTRLIESLRAYGKTALSDDRGQLLLGISSVSMEDHNDYEIRVGDHLISQVFKDRSAYDQHTEDSAWQNILSGDETNMLFTRAYTATGMGFVWKGDQHS